MRTCLRCCRRRLWRPSKRRYLRIHVCGFLECWWNATWLYLGGLAVLNQSQGETAQGWGRIWAVEMTGEDQEIGVGVAVGRAEDGSAAGAVAHG